MCCSIAVHAQPRQPGICVLMWCVTICHMRDHLHLYVLTVHAPTEMIDAKRSLNEGCLGPDHPEHMEDNMPAQIARTSPRSSQHPSTLQQECQHTTGHTCHPQLSSHVRHPSHFTLLLSHCAAQHMSRHPIHPFHYDTLSCLPISSTRVTHHTSQQPA